MYNADRSASGRTRILKAKTLAAYHARNPTKNDYGGEKPSSALTLLLRSVGSNELCGQCVDPEPCEPVCDFDNAFFFPFPVSEIDDLQQQLSDITGQDVTIPLPPDGYPEDRDSLWLVFSETCNSLSYTAQVYYPVLMQVTQHFLGIYNQTFLGNIGFIVVYPSANFDPSVDFDTNTDPDVLEPTITVTASNECSQSTITVPLGCFLEGSPVTMADGSSKPIETVEIGDKVRGAFGEENTVLALHRPILGAGCILNINGEHKTTTHHPHVAADKKIYCAEPKLINGFTYGKEHTVIVDKSGRKEKRTMYGLHRDRILKLEVGVELQTVSGARRVDTLETIKMSPFTQVYHLVVDGSHTFNVDGYAVTGWTREDDFDYDAWTARV
jgi:hypothetical protein